MRVTSTNGVIGRVLVALWIIYTSAIGGAAQPANDLFANRIRLEGTNVTAMSSTQGATVEEGEPGADAYGFEVSQSLWWSWTPPRTGVAYITTQLSESSDLFVDIFTGSSISNLTRIGSSSGESYASYIVVAGTDYRIRVSRLPHPVEPSRSVVVSLQLLPRSLNDLFAEPEVLTGARPSFLAWNTSAGTESYEPALPQSAAGATLWYSWIPPVSGRVTFHAEHVSAPPLLDVFVGSQITQLQRLASSQFANDFSFEVVGGTGYRLRIDRQRHERYPFAGQLVLRGVHLASPAPGALVPPFEPLELRAGLTDIDGELEWMEFLLDGQIVGRDSTFPYSVQWEHPTPGAHTVSLRFREVGGEIAESRAYSFSVLNPVAENDSSSHAIPLTGLSAELVVDNSYATRDPGEPAHHERAVGHTLWWRWTAPTNAWVAFRASVEPDLQNAWKAFPLVAVYRGAVLPDSTPLMVQSAIQVNEAAFRAQQGEEYFLVFDSYVELFGPYGVQVQVYPELPNDMFAHRIALTEAAGVEVGPGQFATAEPGESTMGGGSSGHTLWWTWKSPGTGLVTIRVVGERVVPTLALYRGDSLPSGPHLDLAMTNRVLVAPVELGETYLWQLDLAPVAFPPEASARFRLEYAFAPVASNDFFAQRARLIGLPVSADSSLARTTREPGEPVDPEVEPSTTVWWAWTASKSGPVSLSVQSSWRPRLRVFTGTNLATLKAVVSNNYLNGSVGWNAVAGTTYQLCVGSYDAGSTEFHLQLAERPVNDLFANRILVQGQDVLLRGNPVLATSEVGEPKHQTNSLGRTLWWEWTAPADGTLTCWPSGRQFFPLSMAVYTNSPAGRAKQANLTDTDPLESFPPRYRVKKNQAYQIVVDGVLLQFPTQIIADDFELRLDFSDLGVAGVTNGMRFKRAEVLEFQLNPLSQQLGEEFQAIFVSSQELHSGTQHWIAVDLSSGSFSLRDHVSGTYRIQVVGTNSLGQTRSGEPLFIRISEDHDLFDLRRTLVGWPASDQTELGGSGLEANESRILNSPNPVGSLWWQWTAPLTTRTVVHSRGWLWLSRGTDLATLGLLAKGEDFVVWNASAGSTYQIALGQVGTPPEPSAWMRVEPVAPNDAFAQRLEVSENQASRSLMTLGCTRETGEPNHGGLNLPGSVWFSWTAPSAGMLDLRTTGADSDVCIAAYRGVQVSKLTSVASQADRYRPLRFEVQAGLTYAIAVGGSFGRYTHDGQFVLRFEPSVTNDAFAHPARLEGNQWEVSTANFLATEDPNEPVFTSIGVIKRTLWWEWTPAMSGAYRISTVLTNPAFSFEVFTGDQLDGLVPQASHRFGPESRSFRLFVNAGVPLRLRTGTTDGAAGAIQFETEFLPAVAEDAFAQRLTLEGARRSLAVATGSATAEVGDPVFPFAQSTLRTLWYSWVAPSNGIARLKVSRAHGLMAFRGEQLQTLETLAWTFGGDTRCSVQSGVRYSIALFAGEEEAAEWEVEWQPGEVNDAFGGALELEGSSAVFTASFREASGVLGVGSDLWWRWRAPHSGPTHLTVSDGSPPMLLEVVRGPSEDQLIREASSGSDSTLVFHAVYGREYLIRAIGLSGAPFTVSLQQEPPWGYRLNHVAYDPVTGFRFGLSGSPRGVVEVEVSDDLSLWISAGFYSFMLDQLEITPPSDPRSPARFYRIQPRR